MDWCDGPPYLRWTKWHFWLLFLRVFQFSPVSFIQQFFYTHISIIWHRRCINLQLAAPWVKHWKHINTSVELRLWMRPGVQPEWQGDKAQCWVVGGSGWGSCSALVVAVMNIQVPSAVSSDHGPHSAYPVQSVCVSVQTYRRTVWPTSRAVCITAGSLQIW